MRFSKWLGLSLLMLLSFGTMTPAPTPTAAQDAPTFRTYTWRNAGLILQYPATWHTGLYGDLPMLVSNADGLVNAEQGLPPSAPAIGLLSYPQTNSLRPNELMQTLFPDVPTTEAAWDGVNTLQAQFDDEATAQTFRAIAFTSPVTRRNQVLLAVAPQADWASFEPVLMSILSSVQFLNGDAAMQFLGMTVSFQYPTAWTTATNGQVIVAAPTDTSATAILNGDLSSGEPFVRAQLLTPSGVGIDPTSPTAPQELLALFGGATVAAVQQFEWAEGLPAVAAEFVRDDQTLLLVVVQEGDNVLLIGGGSATATWPQNRPLILGALNMTTFGDFAPPLNLDSFLLGEATTDETAIFGMTIEE